MPANPMRNQSGSMLFNRKRPSNLNVVPEVNDLESEDPHVSSSQIVFCLGIAALRNRRLFSFKPTRPDSQVKKVVESQRSVSCQNFSSEIVRMLI